MTHIFPGAEKPKDNNLNITTISMNKLLERLHFDKYVNVYVIFALDMAVSVIFDAGADGALVVVPIFERLHAAVPG